MPEIKLQNVSKSVGSVAILRSVDLTLQKNEFTVLAGPSGSGKSTLLRLIAGLDSATSGTITVEGQDVTKVAAKDRNIAMVFQSDVLYPNMRVWENMSFSLRMSGLAKADILDRVNKVASLLGLDGLLDQYPHHLTIGQRQRVAIGRAVVRDPKAFLFDEPLSRMDRQLAARIRGEIKLLHRNLGRSMIYVTHDQHEAMSMADKIVVMNEGRIEQVGTPQDLYDNPATAFVAGFIGAPEMNFIAAQYAGGTVARLESGIDLLLPGRLDCVAGTQILYGVRPQHISVGPNGIPFAVTMVEPMGDGQQIFADLRGQPLVILLQGHPQLSANPSLGITINTSKVLVFDRKTGRRIPSTEVWPGQTSLTRKGSALS